MKLTSTLVVLLKINQKVFFMSKEGINEGKLSSYQFSLMKTKDVEEKPNYDFIHIDSENNLIECPIAEIFKTKEETIAFDNFEKREYQNLVTKTIEVLHLPLNRNVIFKTKEFWGIEENPEEKEEIISQGKIVKVSFFVGSYISVFYTVKNELTEEEVEVCHSRIIDSL